MTTAMLRWPALAGLLALTLTVACGRASGGGGLFDYDQKEPLDIVRSGTTTASGVVRETLSYATAGSVRLQAYYVHPSTPGRWPVVIWSPGYGGDRRQQLPEADSAARLGVASLLVNEVFPSKSCDADTDVRDFVLNVVSRRRAIDVARSLPNVDPQRIAAAGFSYGASITAALSGVDHRLAAVVLQSGRGHFSGYARDFCGSLGTDGLAAYMAKVGRVDAVRWVHLAAHAAFLIQSGTRDPLSPRPDVLALYAATRGSKELRWYAAGHELDAAATTDRVEWLERHLHSR